MFQAKLRMFTRNHVLQRIFDGLLVFYNCLPFNLDLL